MKKNIISALIVTTSLFSTSVLANSYQGYQPATSIAAINAMQYVDDMPVNLSGTVGQQVGPEHFQFTDSQGGSAIVEIDHEEQYRFGIKSGSKISFFGEAEKEYGQLKIDLEFVTNGQPVHG